MFRQRMRASLRGWGGVGAMAVGCVLALAFALLLPLTQSRGGGGAGVGLGGPGLATGSPAKAGDCENSQAQNDTWSPSSADGETIDAIKARKGAKRKLIVGVDQNSYRWGYRNPNNSSTDLEGFDIDLVHKIAQEILGDPDDVTFKAIPTSQRITAIQHHRVDMVVRTMTITCQRLDDVAFSAPYFKTGQQVLAPKSSPIKGYDATLANKRVCTAASSTAYDDVTADKGSGKLPSSVRVTVVPNQLDCLVRLQLGEVDAVVTDGALAASQAAQDPTVALKGAPFTTEYYGVAMNKDATDLVRRVNQILVDYRADGWQDSYNRWLSATLGPDSSASKPPTPQQYLRKS